MCIRDSRIGDNTEFGKVAVKATEKVEGETPLNRQLDSLAKFIGVVGLISVSYTHLDVYKRQDIYSLL